MARNGIAIIGAGMIAAAHANGYRTYAHRVAGLDASLDVVCDTNEQLARSLADTWGFERVEASWQSVLADPCIGIVSVCLPNFLHSEVTDAALKAGKHVLCEKPLALNADRALATWQLAKASTKTSGTVFNYRRIPAIADMQRRLRSGELGEPVQMVVIYQCDYAADPLVPHSWRYEFDKAGPGALLDLGTHAIDLVRFMLGDVDEVIGAASNIAVKARFVPRGATTGHNKVELSDEARTVDNDDVMSALLRMQNGAQAFVTASRVAVGTGNRIHVEVFGTKGSARFSNEMPTHFELAQLVAGESSDFRRMINRPSSPSIAALAPVPHDLVPIGYAESFGFMIHEFLLAVAQGGPLQNGSIEDGFRASQILDAIQASSVQSAPIKINQQN